MEKSQKEESKSVLSTNDVASTARQVQTPRKGKKALSVQDEIDDPLDIESEIGYEKDVEWVENGAHIEQGSEVSKSHKYKPLPEVEELLKAISEGFSKSYSKIQGDPRLDNDILKDVTIEQRKKILKNGAKRLGYHSNKQVDRSIRQQSTCHSKKRTSGQANLPDNNPKPLKRQAVSEMIDTCAKAQSLGETLILNYVDLNDETLKVAMVTAVDKALQKEPALFQVALEKQVQVLASQAIQYYEAKEQVKLSELLSSLQPMAAILLNIKILLAHPNLSDEGNTLSYTLLPYLNQCMEYSFLQEQSYYIVGKCLESLCRNIKDIDMEVGKGFMILALKLNPTILQEILIPQANKTALTQALIHAWYAEEAATIMVQHPKKFLWPQLLKFFEGKSKDTIIECVTILAKMDILKDPGDQMNSLIDIFAQRKLIVVQLLQVKEIRLSVAKLVLVLEQLKRLEADAIKQCLAQESTKWEQLAAQYESKKDLTQQSVSQEVLTQLYTKYTSGIEEPVSIEAMREVSKALSEDTFEYQHSEYQAVIAAIAASQTQNFTIVTMPTGSGKTWVQALLAKHFYSEGLKIVLVEPNADLQIQAYDKIGSLDFRVFIRTVEDYYECYKEADILLIDEYDEILMNIPYGFPYQTLDGIWSMRDKKIIAFSATSTLEVERLVSDCIAEPKVLRFQSEYELINGSSPIQDGQIVTCATQEQVIDALMKAVARQYDLQPIIIAYDRDQKDAISKRLQAEKYRLFIGTDGFNLVEIRDLDQGIFMIEGQESRGLDIRFAKDAIVLITARVKNYHDYLQILGRGSRTRNVCDGILYVDGNEKPTAVMHRLKRSNMMAMDELSKLLNFLEKNSLQKIVVEALLKYEEKGRQVRTLRELEKMIPQKQFMKMMKEGKK